MPESSLSSSLPMEYHTLFFSSRETLLLKVKYPLHICSSKDVRSVEITRDVTESLVSLQHPEWSDVLEIAWTNADFSHLPTHRPFPDEAFFSVSFWLLFGYMTNIDYLNRSFSFQGGRSNDSLPSEDSHKACSFQPHSPLRVFADDVQVYRILTVYLSSKDDCSLWNI